MAADDDWLADDEGNLRPEVARALGGRHPTGNGADRVEGRETESMSIPWWAQVIIAVAVVIVYASITSKEKVVIRDYSSQIGERTVSRVQAANEPPESREREALRGPSGRGSEVRDDRKTAIQDAFVVGGWVNLREGPGIGHPVIGRCRPREAIQIRGHQDGWCEVSGESGRSGWIFGAYVSESIGPWLGTAVIIEAVRRGARNYKKGPYPGDRVLVEKRTTHSSIIVILPDGERMELREDQAQFREDK